ncbi:putative MFS family arabinose efflux permease [Kribbella steppae]|uniref:Putative MFS family arabinose efflux permease n=1 Tax=Kribbella steppae TaxID=2512223 RepID=A0A4R2HD15_9ACTN|nr:MFS transporter [Kribbella steppae]TCO26259.1 putative MFS family arabinose efflux permease [Kribbella steppae]
MRGRHALIDLEPLRASRPFRRLWAGQVLSTFGGQLAFVAVMFQVWDQTSSAAWTGAVGLSQALPLIVLGLFAGAAVDRVERRRFYLLTISGQVVVSALMASQLVIGSVPVGVLLGLVAAQAAFGAAGGPVARTVLPQLLPRELLAGGIALNRIAFQGAMLIGPALGGLIVNAWGVGVCYLIDCLSFLAALYGVLGLPKMRVEAVGRPGLGGIRDGLAFVVSTPVIRGALITDLAAMVLSMPISLFPVINAERFGNDPRTLGLFLTAIAVGGVTASILSGMFTRLPRPGVVMLVGSMGWGIALALFAFSPTPWVALAFLALAGAADTVSVVSRSTIVQLHTPNELLGRVSAAEQIVGQAGPDLGNLRGGLVAQVTSPFIALTSGAVLCIAAVAAVAVTTPGLRTPTTLVPNDRR